MLSVIKGWIGEKETQFGMWMKLGTDYTRFHDIIVPTQNGTTQIDHILLSRFGIFIVETKNRNGWIFGNETEKYWTQTMNGKKYKFQNPLHQNYKHTKTLASYLQVEHGNIHSVVFFIGDTVKLKTSLPADVMTSGLCAYIKQFQNVVFSIPELDLYKTKLKQLSNLGISNKEHVSNLKKQYSSNTVCPKCGGELKKRMAKQGKSAGNYFYGCANFPRCKYTKKIQ